MDEKFCVFRSPQSTTPTHRRLSAAPARIMRATMTLIMTIMNSITAQDTPPPTPQVQNRTQLNVEKQYQFFKKVSEFYFYQRSIPNLYTTYNHTRIFLQFHKLNNKVALFFQKTSGRIGNTTQWVFKPADLFDKIRNTENYLHYLCTLIHCRLKIASAESLLPKGREFL